MKKNRFGRALPAGALTAGAMSLDATTTEAAIVCHTAPIVIPQNIDGVYLNLVTGATGTSESAVTGWDFNLFASGANTLLSFHINPEASAVAAGGVILALDEGAPIDTSRTWPSGVQSVDPAMRTWRASVSGDRHLGLRFTEGASTYYGWLNLTITGPNGFPAVINRYCYNDTGGGIAAGDDGSAGSTDRIFRNGFDPSTIVYSNGNLSSGPISNSGVAAPEGSNWSELQNATGNTTQSNAYVGFGAAHGERRIADDFTVPVGKNWTLTDVDVYGCKTCHEAPTSPFVGATPEIWNGRPGDVTSTRLCGDASANTLVGSSQTNLFRISNSAAPTTIDPPNLWRRIWRNRLAIPAGCSGRNFFVGGTTCWLGWSLSDGIPGAVFAPSNVIPGARYRITDHARYLIMSISFRAPVLDSGSSEIAAEVPQDFPFELIGTTSP